MQKVAIYARVSSNRQVEEGVSIEAQLKQLKKYALENNYQVTHEFIDRGESARTADRPEFQKMIAVAKTKPKPFNAILIHKTDRFARNREDSIIYKSLLRKECDIDVISITEKFDDSPTGRMMEGIMEVVAEFYSANLSKEVMKGMNEKATAGEALGEPPFGYTINPETKKFKICEPEAEVIRYIFKSYIDGNSMREIMSDLRKNGENLFGEVAAVKATKGIKKESKDRDINWHLSTIGRLLKNEAFIGTYTWGDVVIEDNHPAIIEKEDFELAQDIMNRRATKRKHYKDYLLRGLVFCHECGGSMSQNTRRYKKTNGEENVYRRLRCSNHARERTCYANSHKMEKIEDELLNFFKSILEGEISFDNLDIKKEENTAITEEYAKIKTKYDSIDNRFDKQVELFETGVINIDQLKKYKSRLEKEKEKLEEKLQSLKFRINNNKVREDNFKSQLNEAIIILNDNDIPLVQKQNQLGSIVSEIQISRKEDLMRVKFKM